jgi:hypothetical protein
MSKAGVVRCFPRGVGALKIEGCVASPTRTISNEFATETDAFVPKLDLCLHAGDRNTTQGGFNCGVQLCGISVTVVTTRCLMWWRSPRGMAPRWWKLTAE